MSRARRSRFRSKARFSNDLKSQGGDKPAPRGGERGLVGGTSPTGEAAETLSDVSHVRERVAEFFDLGIQPSLAALMTDQVRGQKRLRIHFRAAFVASDGFKIGPFQRNDLRFVS